MTLVEVLAGLALLATLLVGLLSAKAGYTRQWARASQRIAAAASADRMLARWWQNPAGVPRAARGLVPDAEALVWRTRRIPNGAVEQLDAENVRLEIFSVSAPEQSLPIVTIDLVLPPEERSR